MSRGNGLQAECAPCSGRADSLGHRLEGRVSPESGQLENRSNAEVGSLAAVLKESKETKQLPVRMQNTAQQVESSDAGL